jgi:hypothetical protein
MKEMGNDDDAMNMSMVHIQESNNIFAHFLLHNGFNGNAFKDIIKKVSRQSVMVHHYNIPNVL